MECPLVAIPREIAPLFVNYLALSHDRWNIPTAGIEPIQSTESVRPISPTCCAAESIVSPLGVIGTDAGSRPLPNSGPSGVPRYLNASCPCILSRIHQLS